MSRWTKEEVAEHLKINLTEKAGSYSAAVVVAALYKKLYGNFPKIGLSGAQAGCADSIIPKLPEHPFIYHIQAHLAHKDGGEVICKICGKTAKEIITGAKNEK